MLKLGGSARKGWRGLGVDGFCNIGCPDLASSWKRVVCIELCGAVLHCGRLEVKKLVVTESGSV